MKILLKKLLVFNTEKKIAKEVVFSNSMNIIIGKNKTGKSSLIKSILHILGTNVKLEKSWVDLIDYYYLELEYNDVKIEIIRSKNMKKIGRRDIFSMKTTQSNSYICYIGLSTFSEAFLSILNINLMLPNNKNNKLQVVPVPFYLSYLYIDQDKGWTDVPTPLDSIGYLKNWKRDIIFYITNVINNSLLSELDEISLLQKKYNETKNKLTVLNDFNLELEEKLNKEFNITTETQDVFALNKENLQKYLKEKKKLQLQQIQLKNNEKDSLSMLQIIKESINNLTKDLEYASHLDEEITCPLCLNSYNNNLDNQMILFQDKNSLEVLKREARKDLSSYRQELKVINKTIRDIDKQIISIETQLAEDKSNNETDSILYKKGLDKVFKKQQELIVAETIENDNRSSDIQTKQNNVKKKQEKQKETVLTNFKAGFTKYGKSLNLVDLKPRFTNLNPSFKPYTGSDLTRAVISHISSIHEYLNKQSNFPLSFLIADTPNQQGQDSENLKAIYKHLINLSSIGGQIVIGAEEISEPLNDSINLISLKKERQVLSKKDYDNNITLVQEISSIIP